MFPLFVWFPSQLSVLKRQPQQLTNTNVTGAHCLPYLLHQNKQRFHTGLFWQYIVGTNSIPYLLHQNKQRFHTGLFWPYIVGTNSMAELSLESVRESLIRQEDTIIFSLIERAKFPINSSLYDESCTSIPGFCGSLVQFIVKETEAIQAKAGRYENPEEHPFFTDNIPPSLIPSHNYTQVLHPAATSVNINKSIWDVYFKELLPLFVAEGDDGNYASTATIDLHCLQALSRRIHYGKFVAEVKFKDAPQDYEPAIRAQDRDALMKLLTFESVEEKVRKRVEKKAMVFGQEVSLDNINNKGKYKVDPSVFSRLYVDWVIPLTKQVEVDYLLHRLD